MRTRLTLVLVVIVAVGLAPISSSCGEGREAARPTSSPVRAPRLLDIGQFALLKAHPTWVVLHVTVARRLRIAMLTEHELRSVILERVADARGDSLAPADVVLDRSPLSSAYGTPYLLVSREAVQAGCYRLELRGEGRVLSLTADLHE